MAYLCVENLEKAFGGTRVLRDVSFQLPEGETLSVIGSSGSGKTTLLRCLNFLERPDGGVISLRGEPLLDASRPPDRERDLRRKRLHFGLVFQDFNLFPQYTALENVTLARRLARRDGETEQDIRDRGLDLLDQMGLSDRAGHYPHQLSGGQKQRVAIARALCMEPDVLCFDEPTSALDPELTGEVLRVIRQLAGRRTTMIVVTHEMAFARDVADRLIFMDGGVIVEQGDPRQVINHPRMERTRQFLSRYTGYKKPDSGVCRSLVQLVKKGFFDKSEIDGKGGAFRQPLCLQGFYQSVDHGLQVLGDSDGGSGGSLHLLDGELGVDLGHDQAVLGDFQHAHLGDDLVDAVGSGQGQAALLEDLGVALGGVLHADDALAGADAQVHSAAHAGHLLAGDDPVGQVALSVDLQSAQEAGVHMAAADQAEVGGGVDEAAAESHGGGRTTGIHHVVRIVIVVAFLGGLAGGDDTQLSVDDQLHVLGQIVGDQGGQADAQVHDVAVLQLFGAALGDKAFDLALFHYFLSPSTM